MTRTGVGFPVLVGSRTRLWGESAAFALLLSVVVLARGGPRAGSDLHASPFSFGSPAASWRPLGFASPPRGGFALVVNIPIGDKAADARATFLSGVLAAGPLSVSARRTGIAGGI